MAIFPLSRRRFCTALALCGLAPRALAGEPAPLRLGLTPVFLDDQSRFLEAWRLYLTERLQRPVVFVQRGSYREIVELLAQDQLEAAWLCGFPFVKNERRLRLLAVPLFQGRPLYRSYLIVPAGDTRTETLLDLRGKVFAYSDPDSNSGFLYTQHALSQIGERSDRFFARTFFAWAHRKVVEAVAVELAQGGAVDGYVWETLKRFYPQVTAKTRVLEQSPEFGFPPFAARASLPEADFAALRQVLIAMGGDAEGKALLAQLNLDGFVPGERGLFDGIGRMARQVEKQP
ncbi:MAG: PhnD/SsuA/transferrin family substrate-binding protein [Gammaproteobacteria bacterium]|nr:PhnD/SsuA/transferrin family substrate-binding protein [Gammaproteobacteria bacterium]MBU1654897.1 PhnD/SsuA/transferrin family substrate-binding protein [Gammaproteobacteria bacterium]MBU1960588.1 PhnD/SsuA/transferrin family substrate-binding protein [Gammaproteobacteria bacterium]